MRSLIAFASMLAPLAAAAQEAAPVAAGAPGASLMASGILPFVLIAVVFYFLLIAPQQKKFKAHTAMLATLKKGDEVVTSGGIIGKIVNPDSNGVTTIEIASGVTVRVAKSYISALHGASAPQPADSSKKKKDSVVKNDNVVLKKDQIANDN